jgi:hypothetical protein
MIGLGAAVTIVAPVFADWRESWRDKLEITVKPVTIRQ